MNVILGYECLVSMNEPRLMQYFTATFFVKAIFTMNIFRENVHADFYGYSDVNFIVPVFDPNSVSDKSFQEIYRKNFFQ